MRFFEADLTRPRDKGAVIDAQKTEVQKEIDKFNTLSTETLELQKRIDAIGTEMEAATKALNAEKDPIKAKKLKSEIGAKIGAANSEIANLNKAAGRLKDNANIQWKHIPDVTLKNVLNKSPLLASVIATPGGVVAKVEEFGHTPNGQKTMKFMYG